ncbi:hypothetical protein P170DRAFT_440943 [Aspergillus steynii IBT 23096]|uniref:25S rRNA (Uridine(2843)-N(3))-methyltransferase n=1 Tax=Aspergillus steynii IBT 23096 TaxID=1392250 RepID=A0A2I2FS71_9EURO|nr:uncharacterized protein P170DRAFT_440943 [Aspergillus steynii IBT 23096]PLB43480.1 hypothetical protein P170DRAFT_440943 [Aspergillus steynii IBT 23096]
MGPPRQGSSQKAPRGKKKPSQTPRRTNQGKSAPKEKEESLIDLSATIPFTLQQLLLNVFKSALLTTTGPTNSEPRQLDTKTLIQTIKSHLYNRDFDSAFTDASGDLLRAYALRWSSTRALGYAGIFKALFKDVLESPQASHAVNRHVVCIGGGAGAEIVALAAIWRDLLDESESDQKALVDGVANASLNDETPNGETAPPCSSDQDQLSTSPAPLTTSSRPALTVTAVDIADWSAVVDSLASTIASSDVRGSKSHAAPLVDPSRGCFTVRARRSDVLSLPDDQLRELLHLPASAPQPEGETPATVLVTLMFTLNELFSTSMAKATGFLLRMTDLLQPGTVLLVVDSPGSYSTLKLGKGNNKNSASSGAEAEAAASAPQERSYPMKFLLDHALLSVAQGKWERVFSQDSRWWRRDAARLSYDVGEGAGLEDMRFQVHIYRRLGE